jgi:FtsZ-binding cell division protein ZapB
MNPNKPTSNQPQAPKPKPQNSITNNLNSIRGLEKLREKVLLAVDEIEHLRAENNVLAQRLQILETEVQNTRSNTAALQLTDEPEQLRRKVETFIGAIDQYLQAETDLTPQEEA